MKKSLELIPGEKIIVSCRTHWKNYILPFIGGGISLLFLAVRLHFYGRPLIVDLGPYIGGNSCGAVSLVETVVSALLTLWCVNLGLRQFLERYVITTDRLIHHTGFLNTRDTELRLRYCSNLIMKQSLAGKLLGYGDFWLRSGGVEMFFNDVPSPVRFKMALAGAIEKSMWRVNTLTADTHY